jgi:hypothetical protein
MSRVSSITVGVLLSILAAGDVAAQWNVARFDTDRNRVYASFGLDPALVSSLGYGHVVRVLGHDFQLAGEAGVVTAGMDASDFRARLGVQTSLVRWRSVHLTGSVTAIARGTENTVYRGFNWGADAAASLGVYQPRWFAAAEGGKDKAVITHITHSDWYRRYHYADAKDGWYLDAGGTYHYGAAAGLTIGRAELVAKAGWLRTEEYNDMTPPFYGSVGVGFGF